MNQNKYLLVQLFDDFSGSPKVLSEFSKLLKNYNVLVGNRGPGFLDNSIDSSRIDYFFYKRGKNKVGTLFYYTVSQFFLFFKTLFWILSNRKSNPIVVINTILPFSSALAAKLLGVKVVYYLHEVSIRPRLLNLFLLKVVKYTSFKSIAVSAYVKNYLENEVSNITVIYNPLEEDFQNIELKDNDLFKKWSDKQVVMLCSLKTYKGLFDFVELARLLSSFNFVLVLNCDKFECDNFLLSNNVPYNLTIYCRPENIADIYKSSFLVMNLSNPEFWIETFGLTLLEGMSFYNPAVTPLVGGPLEIVNNMEEGLNASSKDYGLISDFVCNLGSNYELWKDFSLRAKEQSTKFSTKVYSEEINKFFS